MSVGDIFSIISFWESLHLVLYLSSIRNEFHEVAISVKGTEENPTRSNLVHIVVDHNWSYLRWYNLTMKISELYFHNPSLFKEIFTCKTVPPKWIHDETNHIYLEHNQHCLDIWTALVWIFRCGKFFHSMSMNGHLFPSQSHVSSPVVMRLMFVSSQCTILDMSNNFFIVQFINKIQCCWDESSLNPKTFTKMKWNDLSRVY